MRPHLRKGIPEFDAPPLTALQVNELHLGEGGSPNVNFVADLHNLTIYKSDTFDVPYTKFDIKSLVLEEGLVFPHLEMKGGYKAKGKVLVFEFEGEGDLQFEFGKNGSMY